MASSSSHRPKWNYDVFLSFRGEDTRKTFTSHLYEGLNRMGIVTFQDDKRLEVGSSITEELCKAIEESQFAIIIFSKNYASSGWCLDELAKIMKCKDDYGQTVIPVFHNVDPSTIRYQKESFAEAFAKHETRYKDDVEGMQKVQGWRSALIEAANLSGHDTSTRTEAECIQQIVDQIFKYCKSIPSSSQDVVGITTHLKKVKSLLEVETNDIRIVGIWGMGGVGKTTIAREVFSDLFHQFNATCFIADVKEKAERHGIHSLQNTLLSDLLRKKREYVDDKEAGKVLMASSCRKKKVLIVLDDINHKDHKEYLAGDLGWFGEGSRIIVTTRDKRLIDKGNALYEVHTLPDLEAMQVFSRHAFKKEVPDQGFEELSQKVVNHAKGLPLALKVWGGSLHNRDINEWKRFIEQMKKSVDSEIVEKLKISYDDLEPIQQQMFLDIACFFRGDEKDFVVRILESCFGANIGLSVLIERNLVVISEYSSIEMHDLIQEMGKDIVNVQGKRSRLWLPEDIEEVMMNNTGTETIEAIWMMTPSESEVQISKKALKNMNRLRMLRLLDEYEYEYEPNEISFHDDTFKYLSNNLSCFVWHDYRGESLPPNFEPKGLVYLDLSHSSLLHLWNGRKNLTYLRYLDLSCSGRLIEAPDFSGMPNLEYLYLLECCDLKEVHPSLGNCTKLIRLDLCMCESLKRFPCVNVESLEYLQLGGCYSLEKFPEIIGSMKSELEIDMGGCGIRELPSSIFQYPTHMTELDLSWLVNIVTLPNSICKLKSLVVLDVQSCSKLESLPEEIGDLENLEELDAHDTLISRPPSSIVRLNKLKILRFDKREVSEGHFVFPRVNQGLRSLEELNLTNCNLIDGGLPEDIGCLSSLKRLYLKATNFYPLPRSIAQLGALDLSGLENIVTLPNSISKLKSLVILNVSKCSNLESLTEDIGDLENLEELDAHDTLISRPPSSIVRLNKLKILRFDKREVSEGHFVFPRVNQGLRSLEELNLTNCNLIDGGLPEDIGCLSSLKRLYLKATNFYPLPRSIAQLGALDLSGLENIVTLPNSISKLKSLVILNVSKCSNLESLTEDIGDLENLEELDAHDTLISRPPSSIVRLNKLKILRFDKREVSEGHFVFPRVNQGLRSLEELNLTNCNLIDGGLPEDIGCLSSLKWLYLRGNNFGRLPRSIAQLGALEVLGVSFCKRLRELPELPPNVEELRADYHMAQSIQNYENLKLLIFTEVEFDDSVGDLFAQTLLKCILSLRKAFSASDSLSQRAFVMWHPPTKIPNWFKYDATPGRLLLVKLPESWYANGKFLGFAICYYGASVEIVVELIPSSNGDDSEKLSKRLLAVPPSRETMGKTGVSFYFIPLASLWDTSKANGKTPNAYGHLKFSLIWRSAGEFGFRLLYKDDELEHNHNHNHNHKRKFGEHYDSMTNDFSCSFSKKQMSHSNIRGSSIFENLPQQEEGPSTSGLLQLFPENPGS